jgi:hypothetical protein
LFHHCVSTIPSHLLLVAIIDLQEGCGSGCRAYSAKHPDPTELSDKLPLAYFGKYKKCMGDRWPPNLCSLKRLSDPKKPVIYSKSECCKKKHF